MLRLRVMLRLLSLRVSEVLGLLRRRRTVVRRLRLSELWLGVVLRLRLGVVLRLRLSVVLKLRLDVVLGLIWLSLRVVLLNRLRWGGLVCIHIILGDPRRHNGHGRGFLIGMANALRPEYMRLRE